MTADKQKGSILFSDMIALYTFPGPFLQTGAVLAVDLPVNLLMLTALSVDLLT